MIENTVWYITVDAAEELGIVAITSVTSLKIRNVVSKSFG